MVLDGGLIEIDVLVESVYFGMGFTSYRELDSVWMVGCIPKFRLSLAG